MSRPAIAVLAVIALIAAALTSAARTHQPPPPQETAAAWQTVIARERSCPYLQRLYAENHAAWKAAVKAGMDGDADASLDTMKAILRRLAELEQRGRCGG